MKAAPMEFECECKVKTIFEPKLPDVWKPTLTDVKCHGCSSVWVVKLRRRTDGLVNFTFRLRDPSAKLGDYLKKKKYDEIANRPQPKDPKIYIPSEFKK